jgi:hypothetical protein
VLARAPLNGNGALTSLAPAFAAVRPAVYERAEFGDGGVAYTTDFWPTPEQAGMTAQITEGPGVETNDREQTIHDVWPQPMQGLVQLLRGWNDWANAFMDSEAAAAEDVPATENQEEPAAAFLEESCAAATPSQEPEVERSGPGLLAWGAGCLIALVGVVLNWTAFPGRRVRHGSDLLHPVSRDE